MNTEDEAIVKELVGSIRRLLRAVYLDSQRISRQYGLTGPQSGVLRSLFNKGSMSSADLSRLTYVTPSNITGIIDRLENKGLVERIRVKGDRRIALITLTHKGEALSKTLPDPIEERLQVIRQAFIAPGTTVYQSPAEWQRENWKIDPPDSAIFVLGKGR